jgi:hypothetical protein
MKKLLISVGLVGLVVVSVFAIATTSTALAQGQTPPAATPNAPTAPKGEPGWGRGHGGFGFERSFGGQAGLDAAAKALGMTTDELSAELWGGRTLADLADKAGVKLADVQKAVQDANLAAMKDSINQAVTDGKITQDQADWLIQGLDKGYWGGKGFGGFGFGGHRGGMGGMFGGMRYAPQTSGSKSF